MHDDDVWALDALLVFLYTGNYFKNRWCAETGAADSDIYGLLLVKHHIEVVLLADKYDVPGLKEYAILSAKQAADEHLTVEWSRQSLG